MSAFRCSVSISTVLSPKPCPRFGAYRLLNTLWLLDRRFCNLAYMAHKRITTFFIVSNVTLKEFQNGTPPCHAQFQDLFQIGFLNAGSIPNRRRAGCNGEIFIEGILEAIIELGRNQLTVTTRRTANCS
jgi:hypothetical protein